VVETRQRSAPCPVPLLRWRGFFVPLNAKTPQIGRFCAAVAIWATSETFRSVRNGGTSLTQSPDDYNFAAEQRLGAGGLTVRQRAAREGKGASSRSRRSGFRQPADRRRFSRDRGQRRDTRNTVGEPSRNKSYCEAYVLASTARRPSRGSRQGYGLWTKGTSRREKSRCLDE
jgi:hypothetical protein